MFNALLEETDPNLVKSVLFSHLTAAIKVLALMKKIQQRRNCALHLFSHSKQLMRDRKALKDIANASKHLDDEINFMKARNSATKSQRKDMMT